jgi:DNA-binding FadR family transcriptional regulator
MPERRQIPHSGAEARAELAPLVELVRGGAAEEPLADPLQVTQLYQRIAERIAGEIRRGLLRPGERLPAERELARRLDVGRTSVREAIGYLQVNGIVETKRGSGSYIAEDAHERVHALFAAPRRTSPAAPDASPSSILQARELFEPAIARLAAAVAGRDERAEALLSVMESLPDPEDAAARATWNDADRLFHRQIGVMTKNPVVVAHCDQIAELMNEPLWRRLRVDSYQSITPMERVRIQLADHRLIYESVAAGDGDAAGFYAAQHIRHTLRYMTIDDAD